MKVQTPRHDILWTKIVETETGVPPHCLAIQGSQVYLMLKLQNSRLITRIRSYLIFYLQI